MNILMTKHTFHYSVCGRRVVTFPHSNDSRDESVFGWNRREMKKNMKKTEIECHFQNNMNKITEKKCFLFPLILKCAHFGL